MKLVEPHIQQFARSYLHYKGDPEMVLQFLLKHYPPLKKSKKQYIHAAFWTDFLGIIKKTYRDYWCHYFRELYPHDIKKRRATSLPFRHKINLARAAIEPLTMKLPSKRRKK